MSIDNREVSNILRYVHYRNQKPSVKEIDESIEEEASVLNTLEEKSSELSRKYGTYQEEGREKFEFPLKEVNDEKRAVQIHLSFLKSEKRIIELSRKKKKSGSDITELSALRSGFLIGVEL